MRLLERTADALMRVTAALAIVLVLCVAAGAQNAPVAVTDSTAVTATDGVVTTTTTEDVTTVSAPDATTVVVPIGNWLTELSDAILSWALTGISLAFAWLLRNLPKQVVDILLTLRVEQLLKRAAEYGVNETIGAAGDLKLTVDVRNAALAKAITYAMEKGAPFLLAWIGGKAAVEQSLRARIPGDEGVGSR
jgi:hypothetical protein